MSQVTNWLNSLLWAIYHYKAYSMDPRDLGIFVDETKRSFEIAFLEVMEKIVKKFARIYG